MNRTTNRRKFVLTSVLAMISSGLMGRSRTTKASSGEQSVKLLTDDGRLVEVPKAAIQKSKLRKKVSNKEILAWTKQVKTT